MAETATIFALSSAPGRAGVAVVRVSGPRAGDLIDALAPPRPRKREAVLRRLRRPGSGETIDLALVLWFGAPRSETGEDMAEFHLHGSPAVVKALLEVLGRQPGCRLAEPGEFARRAFENGKIDLAEAEGLADLISAETEAQRRQALEQMGGSLSRLYEGWRAELVRAGALIEAVIDFGDEPDVARDAFELARTIVAPLAAAIAAHLADDRGEILREGFRVVLAGPPNVGKSSLLNALARREAAIVSEEAGTTRDAIAVHLDLKGLPVIVTDTAGLRETEALIEREGIRRTLAASRAADLVVWLLDASLAAAPPPPPEIAGPPDRLLCVANKVDLGRAAKAPEGALFVSAKTGEGIGPLAERLAEIAGSRLADGESPAITRARYREHLKVCMSALEAFMSGAKSVVQADMSGGQADIELRAEDLRQATNALGRITGRVDVEEVLGEIFGRFCIGK